MTGVYKPFFVTVVMILILVSAGCAELPPGDEPSWSGIFSPSKPQETPIEAEPDPGYLTPVAPYPTPIPDMTSPTFSTQPETTPTPEAYVTLYDRTARFTQNTEAFAFDLTAPPLLIDFTVEPKMITREKYFTSDYSNIKSGMVKQTFPSETSWFKVTVWDRGSNTVVVENGFGKLYSADAHKQVYVGRSGNYQIELSGNDVKVHVLMRARGF